MTNEEAIEALKLMNLKLAHPFLSWEEMLDVRNTAISALESIERKESMDDYKELIAALREEAEAVQAIEWEIPICTSNHIADAADVIEQLVTDIDALTKERDAAIADLRQFLDCDVCIHNNDECFNNGLCRKCSVGKTTREHWEWRGITND